MSFPINRQKLPLLLKGSASPRRRRSKPLWYQMWKARTSYLLLFVFFAPFIVFHLYPIANSAYLSLTDYSGSPHKEVTFLGLKNFKNLLSLQIKELPRQVDTESGELMFQCGRRKVVASRVTEYEAKGDRCIDAYVNPTLILDKGFSEWRVLYKTSDSKYIIAASDTRFWTAMFNTVTYVMATVFIKIILGLMLALILQSQTLMNMILRTVFFLPTVTAGVAVTVVWGWIFKGQSYGLVNSIRLQTGSDNVIAFLSDPDWMMPILILMTIWGGMGYNMIMYLAGLQSIPAELYEAATVDGANTRQKFFHITLPLLRPTTIFLIVTGIISSFQIFDAVYILFAGTAGQGMGGNLDAALTVVGYLYERGFRLFQLGYASAIAWTLFLIIFVMTLINLRVGRANEAY